LLTSFRNYVTSTTHLWLSPAITHDRHFKAISQNSNDMFEKICFIDINCKIITDYLSINIDF